MMTEWEKQLQGLAYNPADLELRAISNKAKRLMKEFDQCEAADSEKREQLIHEMVGQCGENVRVNQPFRVDYGKNISIGTDVVINMNCTLLDTGKITIGNQVLIGPDVKIYTALHPKEANSRFAKDKNGATYVVTLAAPVTIGDDVWIGGGTIILPGVKIGSHSIIGAGSIVTQDIPDYSIACGNPCSVKRKVVENSI